MANKKEGASGGSGERVCSEGRGQGYVDVQGAIAKN